MLLKSWRNSSPSPTAFTFSHSQMVVRVLSTNGVKDTHLLLLKYSFLIHL